MQEMVIIVREAAEGWYVEDGTTIGPFISLQRAKDLADGMAAAILLQGDAARVVIASKNDASQV